MFLLFVCVCVQYEESEVKTHHLTNMLGGIMDMDDLLIDLLEDREKVRFFLSLLV